MLAGNSLSATATSATPSGRLKEALSSPPPHPMVVLPAHGGFWSDPPPPGVATQLVDNSTNIANQQYYDNFRGTDHNNYCCLDPSLGPVVLSIKYIQDPQKGCLAEVVSRTTEGNRHQTIRLTDIKDNKQSVQDETEGGKLGLKEGSQVNIQVEEGSHDTIPDIHLTQISKNVAPSLNMTQRMKLEASGVVEKLLEFDDHMDTNVKNVSFGLIYQKFGQTTEEELFSNHENSEAMDSFMEMLGTKVNLMDHKGYQGGLQPEDSEEKSLYTQHMDKQIMFHVSTFLPHSDIDPYQTKKKRKIGNDMMCLVFQDGDTPFTPDMIKSQFLNAYIIVRPLGNQYQVCVSAKDAVKQFEPILPENASFERGPEFREWLLNKLISGRQSCYRSETFNKMLLDGLVKQLMDQETKGKLPHKKSIKNIKSRYPAQDCCTM